MKWGLTALACYTPLALPGLTCLILLLLAGSVLPPTLKSSYGPLPKTQGGGTTNAWRYLILRRHQTSPAVCWVTHTTLKVADRAHSGPLSGLGPAASHVFASLYFCVGVLFCHRSPYVSMDISTLRFADEGSSSAVLWGVPGLHSSVAGWSSPAILLLPWSPSEGLHGDQLISRGSPAKRRTSTTALLRFQRDRPTLLAISFFFKCLDNLLT